MHRLPKLNSRLQGYGTSIFSEMTLLSNRASAINLGQGFPNFNPKSKLGSLLLNTAAETVLNPTGLTNQYTRSFGSLDLCRGISEQFHRTQQINYHFENEITIFSGATEAIYCSFASLLELGDEVIIFEPHYDSYRPSITNAGGKERIVTLRRQMNENRFTFDRQELKRAFNPRTKAILINSPHNPTGTLFTKEELQYIAKLCIEHDCIAVSDEVYEHIVFDGHKHISIATLDGMRDRTITISSAGKTFSVTGWKIGWTFASPELTNALRTAHQFIVFCTATPFQQALAHVLSKPLEAEQDNFYKELKADYQAKRDKLYNGLRKAGFTDTVKSAGTYFLQVNIKELRQKLGHQSDMDFSRWLTEKIGVCAIPSSAFYSKEICNDYVRFAFCKTDDILDEGVHRLITRL
jgi:N-succinyldiaminopimelate aminotransferase